MATTLATPTFLYPHARDFAFDEVCERIVYALEKRHFDVPGIEIEFDVYGSGEQWMRQVRRVTGQAFSLDFCRSQGLLPDGTYNDTAGVSDVSTSGEKISVYADNSGPRYHVYVGDDWERDREKFFGRYGFVNSKLNGEPRTYLCYRASDETSRCVRYVHSGPATYLLHTNNLGREYGLQDDPDTPDEPFYLTSEVIDRMTRYLENELIQIEGTPEKEGAHRFEEEGDIPIDDCPEFWTCGENRDANRIKDGLEDLENLPLARRYGIAPDHRLLSLDVSAGDLGLDADVLHDGYVWSSLNPEDIPRESRSSYSTHRIRIKPRRANDIYVIDEAAYDLRRAELLAEVEGEGRKRFTDKEVGEMKRARAKTLVPWNAYQGNFEKPVIIIGRQLGFDEVEVVDEKK